MIFRQRNRQLLLLCFCLAASAWAEEYRRAAENFVKNAVSASAVNPETREAILSFAKKKSNLKDVDEAVVPIIQGSVATLDSLKKIQTLNQIADEATKEYLSKAKDTDNSDKLRNEFAGKLQGIPKAYSNEVKPDYNASFNIAAKTVPESAPIQDEAVEVTTKKEGGPVEANPIGKGATQITPPDSNRFAMEASVFRGKLEQANKYISSLIDEVQEAENDARTQLAQQKALAQTAYAKGLIDALSHQKPPEKKERRDGGQGGAGGASGGSGGGASGNSGNDNIARISSDMLQVSPQPTISLVTPASIAPPPPKDEGTTEPVKPATSPTIAPVLAKNPPSATPIKSNEPGGAANVLQQAMNAFTTQALIPTVSESSGSSEKKAAAKAAASSDGASPNSASLSSDFPGGGATEGDSVAAVQDPPSINAGTGPGTDGGSEGSSAPGGKEETSAAKASKAPAGISKFLSQSPLNTLTGKVSLINRVGTLAKVFCANGVNCSRGTVARSTASSDPQLDNLETARNLVSDGNQGYLAH